MMETVLITGSNSDIAQGFYSSHKREYKFLLHLREPNQTSSECIDDYGTTYIYGDLSNPESISNQLTDFLNTNGPISHFVHCAGMLHLDSIKRMSNKMQMDIFNVNLFSAIEVIRILLSKHNKRALKSIVLLSALWSIRGSVGNSIYAASKGAVDSLVHSLALELAPNTRVNSLILGAVVTKMSRMYLKSEEEMKLLATEYPLGLGKVDDVSNVIKFLLSDNSRWITGQNIVLDGGRSCR